MRRYCLRCDQLLEAKAHYGQHLDCFEAVFQVKGPSVFQSLIRKESHSGDIPQAQPRHLTSYFGGNYKKYEGALGDAHYILKLSKPEYPELAPVEFVSNKIAYLCKLRVPTPFSLLDYGEGELAFVSRNFMDRQSRHATLNHIYHYLPSDEALYTIETIAEAVFRETRSVEDHEQLVKMFIFDALVGNHDRHGRNIALIETARGKRLAPLYDNPSSLGLESGPMLKASFSPRSKIWTRGSREPLMRDCLIELDRLGMKNIIMEFYRSMDIGKILGVVTASHALSDLMKEALLRLIKQRIQELEDYVRHS